MPRIKVIVWLALAVVRRFLGACAILLKKREGKHVTVAPRQFVVTEYLELLRAEIKTSGQSLGGTISEYAEAGCFIMAEKIETNQPILTLINNE